jgi:hypothetical protein
MKFGILFQGTSLKNYKLFSVVCLKYYLKFRNRLLCTVTNLRAEVLGLDFQQGQESFSFICLVQTGSGVHIASYLMGTEVSSPWIK